MLVGSFEKNLQEVPRSVLWAWLEMFFFPKRYKFSINTLSTVIVSWLNILKGTAKAPAQYGPFEAEQSERNQNRVFNPKR